MTANGKTAATPALPPPPPFTQDVQNAMERWNEVHNRAAALQAENDRLRATNAQQMHKLDWMEAEMLRMQVVTDRYKAANTEAATAVGIIAQVLTDQMQKFRNSEFAPSAHLVPDRLRGGLTDGEADAATKAIAQRFGANNNGVPEAPAGSSS